MEDIFKGIEPQVYKSQIGVPYQWWAGETASKFFIALRDEHKILGNQCPQCGKVFCPPKKTCPYCYIDTKEWKEVGPKGKVVTYTVVYRQLAALKKNVPVAFGLIQLDGADNAMLHYIGDTDPKNIKIGMEVEAVFAEEKKASIEAILHFRPVK
ncbi:MAG: Zn-ribbon domain-containing OB-fold protein [Spirochaetes bacterium]|nr:Zn-ribbon domain-containing OB-fold protein [Spirochaetota bacterium]